MIMIKILGDKVRPINVRTYVYHYYLYSVSQKNRTLRLQRHNYNSQHLLITLGKERPYSVLKNVFNWLSCMVFRTTL